VVGQRDRGLGFAERDGNLTRDLIRVTDTGVQSGVQNLLHFESNWH